MTQTIDFANAEAPELNRWLAEQPCPESSCIDGLLEQMCDCGDGPDLHMKKHEACNGLGLAFLWASEKCHHGAIIDDVGVRWPKEKCPMCNGSGRVPKAVGLEELLEQYPVMLYPLFAADGSQSSWQAMLRPNSAADGETPLLAALRSVCASLRP